MNLRRFRMAIRSRPSGFAFLSAVTVGQLFDHCFDGPVRVRRHDTLVRWSYPQRQLYKVWPGHQEEVQDGFDIRFQASSENEVRPGVTLVADAPSDLAVPC